MQIKHNHDCALRCALGVQLKGCPSLCEEEKRVFGKGVKNTKLTFKAKHLAQRPENGFLVILWGEINPDGGNNLSVI